MAKDSGQPKRAKAPKPTSTRENAPQLISFLADPPLPSRSVRDLYKEAVRARLGMTPDERNIDDRPWAMSAGEMLLWTIGGYLMDDELSAAVKQIAEDLRHTKTLDPDYVTSGELSERLEWLALRLEVIAALHHGALEHLGRIPAGNRETA